MKPTSFRFLTLKMTLGGGDKGRGGGGTVAQNNSCMVMRAQPKHSQ